MAPLVAILYLRSHCRTRCRWQFCRIYLKSWHRLRAKGEALQRPGDRVLQLLINLYINISILIQSTLLKFY